MSGIYVTDKMCMGDPTSFSEDNNCSTTINRTDVIRTSALLPSPIEDTAHTSSVNNNNNTIYPPFLYDYWYHEFYPTPASASPNNFFGTSTSALDNTFLNNTLYVNSAYTMRINPTPQETLQDYFKHDQSKITSLSITNSLNNYNTNDALTIDNTPTNNADFSNKEVLNRKKRNNCKRNNRGKHPYKRCSNCGRTDTPSWRRGTTENFKGCLLCNACGLYEKTAKRNRMLVTYPDGATKVVRKRDTKDYTCIKCGGKDATRWIKVDKSIQCDKCARYQL